MASSKPHLLKVLLLLDPYHNADFSSLSIIVFSWGILGRFSNRNSG